VKKSFFSRLDPEAQLALDESLEQIRLKEFVHKPAIAMRTFWPAKSEMFIIQLSSEKVC